jgi:putative endonuclease
VFPSQSSRFVPSTQPDTDTYGRKDDELAEYYVYVLTNDTRTPYTGVTNNPIRRMFEHKHHLVPGFSAKYNVTQLVYVESTIDVKAAISREKQIKGWARQKKIALIDEANPTWLDLSLI